jgi:ferredoxin-nitrate reductase
VISSKESPEGSLAFGTISCLEAEVLFALIKPKTVFIPLSHRDVNYLTDNRLDPLSKEPDYNYSTVKIIKC